MIYILTGQIRTGKTTALVDWAKNRKDVEGLLSPDNEFGKRCFFNIKTEEISPLEDENASEVDSVSIGAFRFLKSAFKEANNFLISTVAKTQHTYLVIDELGKLELKNEGLHFSAKTLIPEFMCNKSQHLILVVRDYLVSEIIEHYHISDYVELKKADLGTL